MSSFFRRLFSCVSRPSPGGKKHQQNRCEEKPHDIKQTDVVATATVEATTVAADNGGSGCSSNGLLNIDRDKSEIALSDIASATANSPTPENKKMAEHLLHSNQPDSIENENLSLAVPNNPKISSAVVDEVIAADLDSTALSLDANEVDKEARDNLTQPLSTDVTNTQEDDVFCDDTTKYKYLQRLTSLKVNLEDQPRSRISTKQFSDSNFYETDGHKYPTADEQREMARRMAHSVYEPANIDSRGYKIFVKCRAKCARWTTGVTQEELAAALAFVDEENKKLELDKNSPSTTSHISAETSKTSTADATNPRVSFDPQTFLDLSKNLLRRSDKGSRLFAQRQAKSESWVVSVSPPSPSQTPTAFGQLHSEELTAKT